MSQEARTISVHILGQEFRIRSSEDAAFVREVAFFVDEVMHRISSKMTSGTSSQVAVLAALNIAEELFRERRGGGSPPSSEVEQRLRNLIERVESLAATSAETVPQTSANSSS